MTPDSPEGTNRVLNTAGYRPLLFETLRAYRHWTLDNGVLHAPHHKGYTWKDGENIAGCEQIKAKSTECAKRGGFKTCSCGFYCVWDHTNAYAKNSNLTRGTVFGVIEMYGTVTLGPNGARATKARIVALHVPPPVWRAFQGRHTPAVMLTYPSVRFYRDRANLVTAEGVEKPKELLDQTSYTGEFG